MKVQKEKQLLKEEGNSMMRIISVDCHKYGRKGLVIPKLSTINLSPTTPPASS